MHTFYLPPEQWQEELELSGAEAHHMGRVLRLHPGDEVLVLDGVGKKPSAAFSRLADSRPGCAFSRPQYIRILLRRSFGRRLGQGSQTRLDTGKVGGARSGGTVVLAGKAQSVSRSAGRPGKLARFSCSGRQAMSESLAAGTAHPARRRGRAHSSLGSLRAQTGAAGKRSARTELHVGSLSRSSWTHALRHRTGGRIHAGRGRKTHSGRISGAEHGRTRAPLGNRCHDGLGLHWWKRQHPGGKS